MASGGDHRRQQPTRKGIEQASRERNAERVVNESESQVLFHVAGVAFDSARACAMPRRSPLTKVTCHCSWQRRCRFHCDSDVCLGQCGGVMMPSPAMATTCPSRLQLFHQCQLVRRLSLHHGSRRFQRFPTRFAGGETVAGCHDDLHSQRFKAGQGFGLLALIGSDIASRPARRPSTVM